MIKMLNSAVDNEDKVRIGEKSARRKKRRKIQSRRFIKSTYQIIPSKIVGIF